MIGFDIREAGKHMSRERYQRGFVEKTGVREKKWKCHYFTYRIGSDGQERRVHHSFMAGRCATMTKAQAQKALDERIQRETGQTPAPDSRITFEQFLRDVYLPVRERQWAKNTRMNNKPLVKFHILPGLGACLLEDLNKARIEKHIGALAANAGQATLERVRGLIHSALEEAVDSGYLQKNPCHKISLKNLGRQPGPRRHLAVTEVRHLLGCLHGRLGLVYRTLLLCGLRIGEVLALRWSDIGEGLLRVDESAAFGETKSTKTERVREVPLPAQLAADLAAYRQTAFFSGDEDFIFGTRRGRVMFRQHATLEFQKEARRISGIEDLTFQVCRRTFSTLIKAHAETRDIQAMLGHSRVSTTLEHYIQPVTSSQREAVERLAAQLFTNVH